MDTINSQEQKKKDFPGNEDGARDLARFYMNPKRLANNFFFFVMGRCAITAKLIATVSTCKKIRKCNDFVLRNLVQNVQ